jgi:hypothetical protein
MVKKPAGCVMMGARWAENEGWNRFRQTAEWTLRLPSPVTGEKWVLPAVWRAPIRVADFRDKGYLSLSAPKGWRARQPVCLCRRAPANEGYLQV